MAHTTARTRRADPATTGAMHPERRGRSMDYTEADRTAHYTGSVRPDRCPVCLMGMTASHGRTDVEYR